MTITLDGTTGITTPDITSSGSLNIDASAPDNSLVVNSAGNVGIGTTSISGKLSINGEVYAAAGAASGVAYGFYPKGAYGNTGMFSPSANTVAFATTGGERVRITSSGNLLVGGTGTVFYSHVLSTFNGVAQYGFVSNDTSGVAAAGFFACTLNGTSIGSITRSGTTSAVLYNTTSDQRLKENIAAADGNAVGIVKEIKVRKYDWKEGGQHEDYGFIAQELMEVVPTVVTEGRTEEDMWSVDYGKLTPLLTAAIQEQQALITQQAAAIEALTARISALEAK